MVLYDRFEDEEPEEVKEVKKAKDATIANTFFNKVQQLTRETW